MQIGCETTEGKKHVHPCCLYAWIVTYVDSQQGPLI